MNFGAVYENFVAQELAAHGYEHLYYYNSKKHGEVDFLVEQNGAVLPIEVKSGRDFKSHAALDNLMGVREFAIPEAWVVNPNVKVAREGKLLYLPIYFLMFLNHNPFDRPMIYRID